VDRRFAACVRLYAGDDARTRGKRQRVWVDSRLLKALLRRIALTQQADGQMKAHSCRFPSGPRIITAYSRTQAAIVGPLNTLAVGAINVGVFAQYSRERAQMVQSLFRNGSLHSKLPSRVNG